MAKNILITGAAKRIGAACVKRLHAQGCNIFLHYHHSEQVAWSLAQKLNQQRPDSVQIYQANLLNQEALLELAEAAQSRWGSIDVLINNASLFYPQTVEKVSQQDWEQIMGCHLKAPFFLSQALQKNLIQHQGCIINIIDIHADKGLKDYPVYSIAKAGLAAMTRVLAKELAPNIRVNGISPGAMMWPEHPMSAHDKADIIQRIALKRLGEADHIAQAVQFLIFDADYITGQIITVDGGRTLFC